MTAAPPAGSGTTETGAGTPRRRAVGLLLGISLVSLLADLGTKQLALTELPGREPVSVLGGAVYFTLTRNSGAAWSIGADHTWIFPLITFAVIGWIGWMALRLRSLPWAVSLGLVLGGALGNLTDRIFRAPGHFVGHVVDMISLFGPYGEHYPVFNLADSSLCCGVVLAVFLELTGRQRDGSRARAEAAAVDAPADERERA
ncbi:signal peptidase II [Micromonospora sp. WMMC241]|uniref:signal peptidase II n=1 Tax=Micromonospora sp. WMMC241 TaxID=3015159 RepID=UPI0022B5F498|nr:signal peptidase II [Micromonospora sp. WMMC241]MCZ7436365.1 signal peptidase II [Micromonospora sp. WMMC241]